ncbi:MULTISPECIES: type II toxin-antitoxin system YafQ family toxin [Gardnerella]|uniref:Addiction module toxin RelE n=1 Tax=Gardnerella swidsinskii TaxID=2792979 RepID=A0ABM6GIR6_9BIFI|nr:addiction module toxin RelE [Gardnerella vaginalis]
MSKPPFYSPIYLRDVKKYKQKHYDIEQVINIVRLICNGADSRELATYRDHILKGSYKGVHELHVSADVLLLYQVKEDCIIFLRLGSHDDLF